MPSQLEFDILARLAALEKLVAALEKKLAAVSRQSVETPQKKEVVKDAKKK